MLTVRQDCPTNGSFPPYHLCRSLVIWGKGGRQVPDVFSSVRWRQGATHDYIQKPATRISSRLYKLLSDYSRLIALLSPDTPELDTSLDADDADLSSCLGRSDASSSTNCACCAKWLSSVRKRLVVRRTGDQLGQRISAHWEWIPRRFAVAADVQRSVAANSCVQL